MFSYLKSLYELQSIDTAKVDDIIAKLLASKTFEERIKAWFDIDMSARPEYEYGQSPEEPQNDLVADSGILLCGRVIYLASPTKDAQIRYSAARADRVVDLLSGLVDHIENLHKVIKTHLHYGTPASVLNPDAISVQKIDDLSRTLQELKDKLASIASPKVFIP